MPHALADALEEAAFLTAADDLAAESLHQPTPSRPRVSRACSQVAARTTSGIRNNTATTTAAWRAHAPARVGPPQER